MTLIKNPHDTFFKGMLHKKEYAAAFLQGALPQELLPAMDFNSLQIEKDSFLDNQGKEHFTDLLYSFKIFEKEAYIYCLFEHKSYPDAQIALQLLRYMIECWNLKFKQKSVLPLILPIVFYHSHKTWKPGNSLADLFKLPDPRLAKYLPNFEFELVTSTENSLEKFHHSRQIQFFIQCLSLVKQQVSSEELTSTFLLLKEIDLQEVIDIGKLAVMYLSVATNFDQSELSKLIATGTSSEGERIIMGAAEKWIQEGEARGEARGRSEGRSEGRVDILYTQLRKKFKNADLPQNLRGTLLKLSCDKLELLGIALFDFSGPEDLKQWLDQN